MPASRMFLLATRLSTAAARPHPRPGPPPGLSMISRRALAGSPAMALKESNSHQPDPEAIERHKQDSLAKQKKGQGHWKPELASDSEESLKADRTGKGGGGGLSEADVKELQERTKRAAEEASKNGTSVRDGL